MSYIVQHIIRNANIKLAPTAPVWSRHLAPLLLPYSSMNIKSTITTSSVKLKDKVTHTGQYWHDDDYRMTRFINREKQINEQFAIDLLAEEEVTVVAGNHVYCGGGSAALGHPKVYINLDKPQVHSCGYCGKTFISQEHKDKH